MFDVIPIEQQENAQAKPQSHDRHITTAATLCFVAMSGLFVGGWIGYTLLLPALCTAFAAMVFATAHLGGHVMSAVGNKTKKVDFDVRAAHDRRLRG